jgi:hydrogenase nickel incorporation protein HypA/HybF
MSSRDLAMHELSVCQALLEQVATVAKSHRAQSVSRIVLRIGPLSGVEPQLLQAAFPLARGGTFAATAELVIEDLPIRVKCEQCGAETDATANRLLCGRCGDWHTRLLSGDELLLASVELLEAEEACATPVAAT